MGDFVCDAMLNYIANQVCGWKCECQYGHKWGCSATVPAGVDYCCSRCSHHSDAAAYQLTSISFQTDFEANEGPINFCLFGGGDLRAFIVKVRCVHGRQF